MTPPPLDWHQLLTASGLLLVKTACWVAAARIVARALGMFGR